MRVVKVYEEGYRYGILVREDVRRYGREVDEVVVMGSPLDVYRYPSDEYGKHYTETDLKIEDVLPKFIAAGTRLGITEYAAKLLGGGE